MRFLLLVAATMFLMSDTAKAHKDRAQWGKSVVTASNSVTVAFAGGDKVTFQATNRVTLETTTVRIASIIVQVGLTITQIPQDVCAKLRDVRFETARLVWNGSYATAAEANYYWVDFDVGPVINRSNRRFLFVGMHQEP